MNLEEASCSWFAKEYAPDALDEVKKNQLDELPKFAEHCLGHGVEAVYITLDEYGCAVYFKNKKRKMEEHFVKRVRVEQVVDTTPADILPGVLPLLEELKSAGIKTGLGSASSNARPIIEKVGIAHYLDAIVGGTKTKKAKPDPEFFLRCAEELGVAPANCIVFEDAQAGVEAAKRGGMTAIGIGDEKVLGVADCMVGSLEGMSLVFSKKCLLFTISTPA